MQIFVVVDKTVADECWCYAIGPGVDVFAVHAKGPNFLNPEYKILPARKLPILEITEWPMEFGIINRVPPGGTHITMFLHDSWTGKRMQYNFLNEQARLELRRKALRDLFAQANTYIGQPPKWVHLVGDLFGLP